MKDLQARISSVRVNPAPRGFFATSFYLLLVAVVVGASMSVLMADCLITIFCVESRFCQCFAKKHARGKSTKFAILRMTGFFLINRI
jgi:hypothetical protein